MKHSLVIIALSLLLSTIATFAFAQSAQELMEIAQEQVGYDDLVTLVGNGLENGTGVTSAQVEAPVVTPAQSPDELPTIAYMANPSSFQFDDTVFADGTGSNIGSSSHASRVGFRMYGSRSMATGLGQSANPITAYEAGDFLFNQTNLGDGSDPEPFNFDVSNHSYILYQSQAPFLEEDDALAINLLQRLDFMADQNESTMCVGVNNGSATAVPEYLAFMYNAISVGLSCGDHSSGVTSLYGTGRTKPDIVAPVLAPDDFTSFSTPMVTASAAILHEAGSGTDATKTETIRALLLSGATKDEFTDWDRTTTRPLDEVFGAGELNILNSYVSLQGGEFDGSTGEPTSSVGLNGWDYESQIVAGNDLFYQFDVTKGTKLDQLSIVLCWNMEIIDQASSSNQFNPTENLGDLNLDFYDSSGSFLGSLLDESKSAVDNVEHIYLQDLPAGTYHLKVSSDTNRDFGLAWRSTSSDLLMGDVNQDGTVNFFDISPFIEVLADSEYQFEADLNCDEVVDFFDISPFIMLLSQ